VATRPKWSDNGKEIFFIDDSGKMMAVEVTPRGDALEFNPAKPLFDALGGTHFDTRDGRTFLLGVFPQRHRLEPLQIVFNWQHLLKEN